MTATNIHTMSNLIAVAYELFQPQFGIEILAAILMVVAVYCNDDYERWTKGG